MLFFKKLNAVASAFLLCFALPSCELVTDVLPKQEDMASGEARVFTIKEGSHYADINSYHKRAVDHLRFSVVFDSTAVYTTTDPVNQGDINKLYGLADCGSEHHTNSARFGWRWYNGKLEVHAYTYINMKRQSAYIGAVTLGEEAICEVRMENRKYIFSMNGKSVTMPRACKGTGEGYLLYPYFGGNEAAPHDVTIIIQELPEVMI